MLIETQLYHDLCMALLSEEAYSLCMQKYPEAQSLILAAQSSFNKIKLNKDIKIELYAFSDYLLATDPIDFLSDDEIWYQDKPYPDCSICDEAVLDYYNSDEYKMYKEDCTNKKNTLYTLRKEEKTLKSALKDIKTDSRSPFPKNNISLYEAVELALREATTPILIEPLIAAALAIRQDSSTRSIRSIVLSMLKSGRLKQFNEKYVGLPQVEYGNEFIETPYNARMSFEERLTALAKFVSDKGRMPFTIGAKEEQTMAVWYLRIAKSTDLTTNQMVALYQFQQDLSAHNIPQTVFQYNMQQHSTEYKAFVMRTGEMVNATQNKQLYHWFYRSCYRYSTLDTLSKAFFDDLITFLSDFGYTIQLR